METRPPALIEAAIRRLVPPSCREHVLGDLCERYSSPRQYVVDALQTLPSVIGSQIRRTSDPNLLAFAIALVLRDAYREPRAHLWRAALVDAAAAVAGVWTAEGALIAAAPGAMVAGRALIAGSAATFVVLSLVRISISPMTNARKMLAANGTLSADEFVRDIRQFEKRILQRNRREVIAGVVVIVLFGAALWRGPDALGRVGSGLSVAGVLFILHHIRTKAAVAPIPTSGSVSTAADLYRPSSGDNAIYFGR